MLLTKLKINLLRIQCGRQKNEQNEMVASLSCIGILKHLHSYNFYRPNLTDQKRQKLCHCSLQNNLTNKFFETDVRPRWRIGRLNAFYVSAARTRSLNPSRVQVQRTLGLLQFRNTLQVKISDFVPAGWCAGIKHKIVIILDYTVVNRIIIIQSANTL